LELSVSIRWKLFIIMALLTGGGMLVVLVLAERTFRSWVIAGVEKTFEEQVDGLLESRQERLAQLREWCQMQSESDFLREVLRGRGSREGREKLLEDIRRVRPGSSPQLQEPGPRGAGQGSIPPGDSDRRARPTAGNRPSTAEVAERRRPGLPGQVPPMPPVGVITLDGEVKQFGQRMRGLAPRSRQRQERTAERLKELSRRSTQRIAYVVVDEAERGVVQEVVVTPVVAENGAVLGWFFLGINAETQVERAFQQAEEATGRDARTGLVVDGSWFVRGVGEDLSAAFDEALGTDFWETGEMRIVSAQDGAFLVIGRDLNPGSPLGKGYQVGVFPLDALVAMIVNLRKLTGGLGILVVLVGSAAAWFLSKRFSQPIAALVRGTERVRDGDLRTKVEVDSSDEFGTLAQSFNTMIKDLALKDRYREVLGKVSDPSVARQLMEGKLELGGEVRTAAVLFCDIRGFTSMTEGMDPAEVIELLNEHMIVMTKVVHDHGGVVDKFVGDLVMAVFGVPVSAGADAANAAACALRMIEERRKLDEVSGRAVAVGIGIAYGELVAGCMGSADRLNYTVLGERVNLASRLCSAAPPGEVWIDGAMADAIGESQSVEEREAIRLRGFSGPVPVFALKA
jgi:class 3 adenylate cyclase